MSDITERELKKAIEYVKRRREAKNMRGAGPTQGIWYYVYLKPNWKLFVMCGDVGHVEFWPAIVNGALQKHYDIPEHQIEALENLPYGFPRGRCSFVGKMTPTGRHAAGYFALQHGNDFPSGLSLESEKRKLIGEFNLTTLYLNDKEKVKFVYDEHETMGEEDMKNIQFVIGKVPY